MMNIYQCLFNIMKYQMECIYKRENNVHYNDIWMEKTKKQR